MTTSETDHVLRVRRVAAAICMLAMGLSACSSSSDEDAVNPDDKATASNTAKPDRQAVSGETGNLKDPKGAIAALSDFDCAADSNGAWSAEGRLTNGSKSKTRFIVSVSIIKSKTSEVVGSKKKMFTLKAKSERQFGWDGIYGMTGKELQCVPRVVSGT